MLKERISYKEGLPVNALVANVKEYPIHFHADIEIVYVLAGTVTLKRGCCSRVLKQGDIRVINNKDIHSYYQTYEDNMVLLLQIDALYFSDFYKDLASCFFLTEANGGNNENLDLLRGILAQIIMAFLHKVNGFEHIVIENTHNLISCLMSNFRCFQAKDGKYENETGQRGNIVLAGRLNRIMDYMYENFKRKLTLSEIAEREHLSMFYLSHAIKDATGMNFQDLLGFIRVEESKKLLIGTSKKIGAISGECGFSAVRYYIKHFRQRYGMAPSAYRLKHAGKANSTESIATYDRCPQSAVEDAVQKQLMGLPNEHIGESKLKSSVFNLDLADCMSDKRQRRLFPKEMFELEIMKAAARPFNLFKNLNEHMLFSNRLCMVSTSASNPSDLSNLSILVYNYSEDFYDKLTGPIGKESFLDQLKNFDDEAEILIKCVGISGNFKAIRYKMTKQNVLSACDDWLKVSGTLNKRQALLNSWSTLPNIEASEITVSDTLNLWFKLRGLSAELILIDRK
ncbi:MAG: AraC family transcriptional regulator [Clostridiales bacterium]|nr:AraC family transcriptional regulator [Clostridiales bacterium]